MEPKKRLAIVLAVTVLILGAIFASFGRSIFSLRTPSVVLPSGSSEDDASSIPGIPDDDYLYSRVEVTPNTVQDVIATLTRLDSFYRELSVETFWENGSAVTQVQIWTDDGWSHSRRILPSGTIRHDLSGDGTLYYWYDGSSRYLTVASDEHSADLSQQIPTYETVLAIDPDDITEAGYELRGEKPCIYINVKQEDLHLETRFWVSIDSGLLTAAEQEQDGVLCYRMTSYGDIHSPCPASSSFSLPDGSVLHQVN